MTEWEVIFLVTLAAVAFAVLALRTGIWISEVNSDRHQFREFMVTMRDEFREFRVEMRDEFHGYLGEIREDIRDIRGDIRAIRGDIAEGRAISRKISRDVEEIRTLLLERLPSAAVSNGNPLHLTDERERSQTRYRA